MSKATLNFRAQEKVRMLEKPTEIFIYDLEDNKKVQVGPIQNPPESYLTDSMMQSLVTDPRVSFYSMVQDAISRLPNGRGSLDDIRRLLTDSQFLKIDIELPILLKKIALALTHFQKGQMQPFCAFDPSTRQYVLQSVRASAPAAVQLQQRPRAQQLKLQAGGQPAIQPLRLQQPQVLPKLEPIEQPRPPQPPRPQLQPVDPSPRPVTQVVQQRNVGHLVQVRTPQGLKLYRLASPMQNPRLLMSQGQPQPQPPRPQISSPTEDTVIVRNSDGKLVQMPRSVLKKLINSGQIKQSTSTVQAEQAQQRTTTTMPVNSNHENVLNLLPTVPVKQDQLRPQDQN